MGLRPGACGAPFIMLPLVFADCPVTTGTGVPFAKLSGGLEAAQAPGAFIVAGSFDRFNLGMLEGL